MSEKDENLVDGAPVTSASQTERLLLVSADCHAGPPVRAFRAYLEPCHREALDDYATQVEDYDRHLVSEDDGQSEADDRRVKKRREVNQVEGLWDPGQHVADLDADGITADVIFPQGAMPFHPYPIGVWTRPPIAFQPDDAQRLAGVRAYNRWLADLCAVNPSRHVGVAVLPIRDITASVAEVEWARQAGLKAVSLPPIVSGYAPYNDRRYDPLWAACAALNMPLQIHGAAVVRDYGYGDDAYALTLAEHDFFLRRPLWFMMFSGVFERYPGLKLVFTELRAGWVRHTLEELDSIYDYRHSGLADLIPRRPSEYFASNCYIGASFMSESECADRYAIGVDHIMWGSDYPHREGSWPNTMLSLRKTFAGVPEHEVRLMVGENAVNLYGLDHNMLSGIAQRIGPTCASILDPVLDSEIPADDHTWAFRRGKYWV